MANLAGMGSTRARFFVPRAALASLALAAAMPAAGAQADPLAPVDSPTQTVTVTAPRTVPETPDVLGTAAR